MFSDKSPTDGSWALAATAFALVAICLFYNIRQNAFSWLYSGVCSDQCLGRGQQTNNAQTASASGPMYPPVRTTLPGLYCRFSRSGAPCV